MSHAAGRIAIEIPACGCDCESGMFFINTEDEDEADFPIQCYCTVCGPTTEAGQRCTVKLSFVQVLWMRHLRGLPLECHSLEQPLENIAYCGGCRDHGLLGLKKAAVCRSRGKHQQQARREHRERSRSRDGKHHQ